MSLHIGVIQAGPFVNPCALDQICARRGLAFDATLLACKFLNFNCTFSWYDRLDYGDYDEKTGTATGLVGSVYNGQYDTVVPVLTPTYSRYQAVSFSNAYFYSDVLMATRNSMIRTSAVNWNLLYAFQWPLWGTVALVYIISCIAIITIFHIKEHHLVLRDHKILAFLKISLHLITRQYSTISRHPNYTGVLIVYWALAFVVLTSAYTGSLFSQRVSGKANVPFVDIETFVECVSTEKCSIIASTASSSIFQMLMAPGSQLGDRLKSALKNNPIIVMDKNLISARILSERDRHLVWLVGRSYFDYYTNQNEECLFYTLETQYKDICAFATNKNGSTDVLRRLNLMGDWIRESGVQKEIESNYYSSSDTNVCIAGGVQAQTYVRMADMIVILGFYGLGISASILAIGLEKILRRLLRNVDTGSYDI